MHLRFESAISNGRWSYQPGDVVNWPDEVEAARLVDRGIAEELLPEAAEKAANSSGKPVRQHKPERAVRAGGTEKAVKV